MASIHPSFFLYSLTVTNSTAFIGAVIGQFIGTKQQEVAAYTSRRLSIFRLDTTIGRLVELFAEESFGIIRSIQPFRLFGSSKDLLIVASDSGKITIIEYLPEKNAIKQIHQETFGKTGIRRVIPGEFLTVDPKGRTCMIASIEKNKLVYILNRDSQANITISSPLEAHKSNTILFDVKSLDVGFDNPMFAALEIEYGEIQEDSSENAYSKTEKVLTYYELDLGLNHVVRRFAQGVDRFAHKLIPVPGGKDGPSGVLVCSKGKIFYDNLNASSRTIPIPQRENKKEPSMICTYVVHKMKGNFFILAQNEDGDLLKITMDLSEDKKTVLNLSIRYFDTVSPATSLLIFKAGYLFVVSEFGNHELYQFLKLGDDEIETVYNSAEINGSLEGENGGIKAVFQTREPDNIAFIDQMRSLNPLLGMKVLNLTNEDLPQFYGITGGRDRSAFFRIKRGLKASELVSSELPAIPTSIWTLKVKSSDDFDAYIILSFSNGTLVLSIGETVEEVPDTGFLLSVPTIAVEQMGADILIQVHPRGIRLIRADSSINEWKTPSHRTVVAAATNNRQVVLGLSSSEIVYFELDSGGQLREFQEHKEMQSTISAIGLAPVPEGRQRYPFLAVGCDDSTVRIISLDPENTLENLSVQALSSPASSLCMNSMIDNTVETEFLHIGLTNGVYLRTVLDVTSGQLVDTRTRFLGSLPVHLTRIRVENQPCVLALSSCSWLSYTQRNALKLTPMNIDSLEFGQSFSSEQCPEGLIGVKGQNLRIIAIDDITDDLNCDLYPLKYTPRSYAFDDQTRIFYIGVADANLIDPAKDSKSNGASTTWQSCVCIFDPVNTEVVEEIHMEDNGSVTSLAIVDFASKDGTSYLVVATAQDLVISPQWCKKAFLNVYKILENGRKLEYIHKTEVDRTVKAMIAFQGKLLVGVGNSLRLYDIGMKKLLRKSETEVQEIIVSLQTQGARIIIGDVQDSVSYAVYKELENRLIIFANDIMQRHVTASTMLDYDTVAGGDRFGNIWVLRCPNKASELADNDPSGSTLTNEKSFLNGAAHRLDMLAHYFTNDIPTSLQKVCLVNGGRDILLYTGLSGTIGIMIPLLSHDDVDFFRHLEKLMREKCAPFAGRDHLVHRSYYVPVKSVVDGDMCEKYLMLGYEAKKQIATELERSPADVIKKIEDIRGRNI